MSSVEYYNKNAAEFYQRSVGIDMSPAYEKFLSQLPSKAHILDAGCGIGRDAKYFKEKGYEVTAFDASKEMVNLCNQEMGISAIQLSFQDMVFDQNFDGIWACASLLHVPYEETIDIFSKIRHALKPEGVFYASYKYGDQKMSVKGRDFYNMDEKVISPYLKDLFDTIHIWESASTIKHVAPSPSDSWLNVLCRRIE